MEPVNKSGKRRCKNRKLPHKAPPDVLPDVVLGSNRFVAGVNRELETLQLLVKSGPDWIQSSDFQGRRPVHMVLTSQSRPDTSSCLRYLLENGADIHAATDSGETPLHLAAAEGLLDCTEILVQAGADVSARDGMGLTPLDLARVCRHRKVARYLKNCAWHLEKKKEMQERRLAQTLYSDLVDTVRLNNLNRKARTDVKVAEWASTKGLPPLKEFCPRESVSRYHTSCLSSDQNTSDPKRSKLPVKSPSGAPIQDKQPPGPSSRPWTIFMGLQPEKPLKEPDLRDRVVVWKGGSCRTPQYSTEWDSRPQPAPDLPLDVLERVLFPRAFPSRIGSPRHFKPQDIAEVQHRGKPQGRSTGPWTEVAMHLAEVLDPGHY